jgi:hypothetical protein
VLVILSEFLLLRSVLVLCFGSFFCVVPFGYSSGFDLGFWIRGFSVSIGRFYGFVLVLVMDDEGLCMIWSFRFEGKFLGFGLICVMILGSVFRIWFDEFGKKKCDSGF